MAGKNRAGAKRTAGGANLGTIANRRAAADAGTATYEFGTELADGGGVAAVKNVTYGESGQQRQRGKR